MNKLCQSCLNDFEIRAEDLLFYKKISPSFAGKKYQIPEPKFCPTCREKRRLAFRNERSLYKRKCDHCQNSILSTIAPEKPYTVFCEKCWWSDSWEAQSFGRDYDFSKSFFENFRLLKEQVPLICLFNHSNENSDYVNQTVGLKDCYLIFSSCNARQCVHGVRMNNCTDCVDGLVVEYSELSYECITSHHTYNCQYCQDCSNCKESRFLFDCIGCSNCLFCSNLRNASYCINNVKLSKAEYQAQAKEIYENCKSYENIQSFIAKWNKLIQNSIHRSTRSLSCENSSGDYLYSSKNAYLCFQCGEIEDCAYAVLVNKSKDHYDCNNSFEGELAYQCCTAGIGSYNTLFCVDCWPSHIDTLYSLFSPNSKKIFGCIGLRSGEYSILNKKYSPEEYERLCAKIIEQMSADGSWGEFFPPSLSNFGYNESVASEYYPLEKEVAMESGFNWHEQIQEQLTPAEILEARDLPDTIELVDESITKKAIRCEESKKFFRFVTPEINFYRKVGLALPRKHPNLRHQKRLAKFNPRKIFQRKCVNCHSSILSTYSADRTEKVYCNTCYEKEMS